MKNTYYWFSRFDKLAGLSFKNALRLHFDSIRLFQEKSFSSALALSVIAMEEIAKAILLEDLVWHAMVDETPLDFSWKKFRNILYSHRAKQRFFSSRVVKKL